jgi:hypothetical protein
MSEVVEATLTSAEPELRRATKLSSRSGRSERECGSTAPGRDITEFLPRAQAFADAQTREALRLLDLDERVQALRNATTTKPRPKLGRRKELARKVIREFPEMDGRGLARLFSYKIKVPGLPSFGGRNWIECWDSKDLKLRARCRKWVYQERAAVLAELSLVTAR